jgi:hypothetical protein
LLEVAQENHYAFDPEDFNFVAIRDRIRCYYKSYVQTARKRGLNLPTKNDEVIAKKLRAATGVGDDVGSAVTTSTPPLDSEAAKEDKKETSPAVTPKKSTNDKGKKEQGGEEGNKGK